MILTSQCIDEHKWDQQAPPVLDQVWKLPISGPSPFPLMHGLHQHYHQCHWSPYMIPWKSIGFGLVEIYQSWLKLIGFSLIPLCLVEIQWIQNQKSDVNIVITSFELHLGVGCSSKYHYMTTKKKTWKRSDEFSFEVEVGVVSCLQKAPFFPLEESSSAQHPLFLSPKNICKYLHFQTHSTPLGFLWISKGFLNIFAITFSGLAVHLTRLSNLVLLTECQADMIESWPRVQM